MYLEMVKIGDTGLPIQAVHGATSQWEDLAEVAERTGARFVCCSGPLEWNARSPDDYRRTGPELNRIGAVLKRRGIELLYHNHDFEFEPLSDGSLGMDLLLAALDPTAVSLCVDVGWIEVAGVDAVAFLDRHAARVRIVHLRDFVGRDARALGQGTLDLAPVVGRLHALPHLAAVMVEQDPTTPTPLADMLTSRAYLKTHFGL